MPPRHDPRGRQLARWLGLWQIRRWPGADGLADDALQLWHCATGSSLLAPSPPSARPYELFSCAGGTHRARALADACAWLFNHVPTAPPLEPPQLRRALELLRTGAARPGLLRVH